MEITFDKLEQLVTNIQESIDWVSDLNCGGCGVFAALVAKRLNRIGIPAVVRVGAWSANQHPSAIRDTYHKNSRPKQADFWMNCVSFDHLIVEIPFGGQIFHMDSECFHPAESVTRTCNAPLFPDPLDIHTALRIAKDKGWNHRFNRKQISSMIQSLNHVFRGFLKTNS